MTVASEPIEVIAAVPAMGGTVNFSFDWQGAAQLAVSLLRAARTEQRALTYGTEWTATPAARATGGVVTLLADPAGWDEILIRRATVATQPFDAPPSAAGFEAALDRIAMVLQEQLDGFARRLELPVGLSGLALPPPEAGRVLRWTAAADALENVEMADGGALALPLAESLGGSGKAVFGEGPITSTGGVYPAEARDVTPLDVRHFKGGDVDFSGQTDEAPTLRAAFAAAASSGRTLTCDRAGRLRIDSQDNPALYSAGVNVTPEKGCACEFPTELVFEAGPNLYTDAVTDPDPDSQAAMISFRTSAGWTTPGNVVRWRGGTFDLSRAPAAGDSGLPGLNGLDIGGKFELADVEGVFFDHGEVTPADDDFAAGGGGDSGCYIIEADQVRFVNNRGRGAFDAMLYLSGAADASRRGANAVISGNYAQYCSYPITIKRDFDTAIVAHNIMEDCGRGIWIEPPGYAAEAQRTGREILIGMNAMRRIQVNPISLKNVYGATVALNRMQDWGRWVSDGATETNRSTGNYSAAVVLEGCSEIDVLGNHARMLNWARVETTGKQTVFVSMRDYEVEGAVIAETLNCWIANNRAINMYKFAHESSGSGPNYFGVNRYTERPGTSLMVGASDMIVDLPEGLSVDGTQVVGTQRPPITDSVGGDEQAKINEILAALRAGHFIQT